MSRSNSPFFREHIQKTELSPLLSSDQSRSPRFDVTNGKARKPKPSRTSMPLVYTDFRSPETSRTITGDGKPPSKTNGLNSDPTDESRTSVEPLSHDAITRHSFVTNLENIGSKSVWMILFMPILLGMVVYFTTVPWRYTGWTSEYIEGSVAFISPPAALQAGYMRSYISIPGFNCAHSQCDMNKLNIQAHMVSSEASESAKRAINLLHWHVNVANYASQYYSPSVNGSISTYKTLVVPLPMLRLDSPVFGLNPNQRKIHLLSSIANPHADGVPTPDDINNNTRVDANTANIATTTHITRLSSTEQSLYVPSLTAVTISAPTAVYLASHTPAPTLVTITTSRTYMLTVAILQIVLSLLTFVYLLYIVAQVYSNATMLRDKFADVHKPVATSYGSINSYDYGKGYTYSIAEEEETLALDTDEAPTMWHFILPEQYSAMALLFFLSTWQGLIPSLCTILEDAGVSVSEGMLFSAGLVTSIAQFGLIFTLILYIDGLKYNSKDGRYKPNRRSGSVYSMNTRTYDPFGMHSDTDSIRSNAYDSSSKEYWRRSSTGLSGSQRLLNVQSDMTPLQREYRNAIQLYVTYHHPRSTDFVGFVHKKLIVLLLTWIIVVVYWLLYYPRLWHYEVFTQVQNDNILLRFTIVQYLIVAVSVVWLYWIVQVSITTGLRLRLLKLNASRFRQVAFRTLFFQLQLGLVAVLCALGWYAFTHDFSTSTTFATTLSYWQYVYLWAHHYGLFHPLILTTPPLAVHRAETLVFVSALVYSIAYCMQPPVEDPNTSKFKIQEFVALERSLPELTHAHSNVTNAQATLKTNKLQSKLRQYLIEEDYKKFMNAYLPSVLNKHAKQYFCIESALIYLEISYQTYFPVDTVLSSIMDGGKANADLHKAAGKEKKSSADTLVSKSDHVAGNNAGGVHGRAYPAPGVFDRQVSNNSILSLSNSSFSNSDTSSPRYRAPTIDTNTNAINANTTNNNLMSIAATRKNPFEDVDSEEEAIPTNSPHKQQQQQEQLQEPANPSDNEQSAVEDSNNVNPFEEAPATATAPSSAAPLPSLLSLSTLNTQLRMDAQAPKEPSSCTSGNSRSSNPFESDEACDGEGAEQNGHEDKKRKDVNNKPRMSSSNPFDEHIIAPQLSHRPKSTSSGGVKFSVPVIGAAYQASTNPFADTDISTTCSAAPANDFIEPPVLPSGPKLNLSGVGYTLKSTFSCDKYTTFGFLAESEADKKLVVSFRGSVLGNAVSNLKVAQVTLPSLKRPRSYFTSLIREFSARNTNNRSQDSVFSQLHHHNTYQNKDYSPHIAKLRKDSSDSDDSHVELIKDAKELSFTYEHTPSTDEHNDYLHLLDRMENGDNYDEEYENENNFTPPESAASTTDKINNSQLAKDIKSVGKNIPILNQGFKRVHAGFWNSYSSIREEFLTAVVIAMYQHRQNTIKHLQQHSGVSPTHSWYVPRNSNNMRSPAGTPVGGSSSAGAEMSPTKDNDAMSGIKALFTSPLGKNNPFSPLFSPVNHNNNTNTDQGTANNDATLYPTSYASITNNAAPNNKNSSHGLEINNDNLPLSITFCGHSLGAAIASLAAFELAENLPLIMEAFALEECFNTPKTLAVQQLNSVLACPAPALSLYMYGSPRVGNSLFSSAMSKKIDNIYRIQVNGDLVCMMPKFIGFYRHIGTAVLLDEGESGNIIIQPSIIESSILQHYTGSVHNHSLDKYRACLEACLEPTELTEYLTNEFQNLSSRANTTFVGDSTKSGTSQGSNNNVIVSKRKSINIEDIPEWLVSNSNV